MWEALLYIELKKMCLHKLGMVLDSARKIAKIDLITLFMKYIRISIYKNKYKYASIIEIKSNNVMLRQNVIT